MEVGRLQMRYSDCVRPVRKKYFFFVCKKCHSKRLVLFLRAIVEVRNYFIVVYSK